MPDYKYSREEAYKLYREDPKRFFDEVIHADADDESKLINKGWSLFWTRYHYNLVENGIMEIMVKYDVPVCGGNILDIGSGTGHWLEFYEACFEPSQLWGVDFAQGPLDKLQKKFGSTVQSQRWDISEEVPGSLRGIGFDLINAIGIIFHIVDDSKWRKAIGHLASLLKDRGVLIIGGDFGEITQERGVMRKTRSLQEWQTLAKGLKLNILEVKRYDWWAGSDQGELTNNLLALGKF